MGAQAAALTLRWPWIVLPIAGPIRVSTVLTVVAIFAVVAWRRRSPFLGLIAVMAWASVYEVAFNAIGTVLHGWSAVYLVWLAVALAGWVALAQVRGVVPDWRLALAAGVAVLAWIATTGFAINSPTISGTEGFTHTFSPVAEAFNEVSKTLLGAAYLVGALRAR